jgi:cell division protein YceG involved in septum cleavage
MKKKKTDIKFVSVLLMMVTILIMMMYTIMYVDTQAQRIDDLEIENIRHNDRWGILLPAGKEEKVRKNESVFKVSV